ncbi:MAG: lectin-like protein [Lachnospiraceae bacterium]|nr:lectin-like protein [Lachnospiraceae bacterium]MDD3617335.1 lectin-like protein [Lachnospiraceae bacterium]
MYCDNCGAKLRTGATFCTACGKKADAGEVIEFRDFSEKKDKKPVGLIITLVFLVLFLIAIIGFIVYYFLIKDQDTVNTDKKTTEVISSQNEEEDSSIAEDTSEDEDGKVSFAGHTYKRFDDGRYSWKAAEQICESEGGYLATITSAEEMEFIISLTHDGPEEKVFYWLGGYDTIEEPNIFVWGTGESFDYTNWASKQPDNADWGVGGNEQYIGMSHNGMYGPEGTWNDFREDPNSERGFVCEWDS